MPPDPAPYDDEDEKKDLNPGKNWARPRLEKLKGGGQGDGQPRGDLRSVPGQSRDFAKEARDKAQALKDEQKAAQTGGPEAAKPEADGGSFYRPEGSAASTDQEKTLYNPAENHQPIYDTEGNKPSGRQPLGDRLLSRLPWRRGKGEDKPSDGAKQTDDERQRLRDQELGGSGKAENRHGITPDETTKIANAFAKINPSWAGVKLFVGQNRGKFILGGSTVTVLGIFIAAILVLAPFKIVGFVQNIERKFNGTSNAAIQKETDSLFSNYLKKYVMPGLTACRGSTIDKSCTPIGNFSPSLVGNLYKGWRTARLENTLAEKYGIEFKYDTYAKQIHLKYDKTNQEVSLEGFDKPGNTQTLDEFLARANGDFSAASRGELRAAMKDALKGATRYEKVFIRFKMNHLVKEKYGTNLFVPDKVANSINQARQAGRAFIAERVIQPNTKYLGEVVSCLIDPKCDPNAVEVPTSCVPDVDCAAQGEPLSDPEKRMHKDVEELAAKIASNEDALKLYNDLAKKGYTQVATEKILSKLLGRDIDLTGFGSKLNVLGWLQFGSSLVKLVNSAPEKIKKLNYLYVTGTAVSTYVLFRSYGDQVKDGSPHVQTEVAGSITDTLGPNNNSDLGGNAEAENTPVYNSLFGNSGSSNSKVSSFLNDLSGKAYAASTSSNNPKKQYLCDNGKPPTNSLECDEMNFNSPNKASQIAQSFKDKLGPLLGILTPLASFYDQFFGFITNAINALLGPVLSFLTSWLTSQIQPIVQKLFDVIVHWMFPQIASLAMGGGRTGDLAILGGDHLGNDTAHNVLGGQQLTNQQAAAIQADQQAQDLAEYQRQPLVSRLFDPNNVYSPASKLAMALPANFSDASAAVTGSIGNIFSSLGRSFGALFSIGHANAASGPQSDPFGITQYGYLPGDPVYHISDPEQFWMDNCSSDGVNLDLSKPMNQNYRKDGASHPNGLTGMPENNSTNPCLLIQATVGSAGGLFSDSTLTADDLSGQGPTINTSGPSQPDQIPGNTIDQGTLYQDSTNVQCAAPTRDLGIQDGYTNGQLVKIRICAVPNLPSTGQESHDGFGVKGANGQAVVNARVSGAVYNMAQAAAQDGVNLTAISSFRTMAHQQSLCPCDGVHIAKPGYSNHQMGLAIDFGGGLPPTPGPVPGNAFWDWLSKNASRFGYKNYVNEAWHWSPSGN